MAIRKPLVLIDGQIQELSPGDTLPSSESFNTVLYGVVNPTTEGNNGDFYINTVTNTLFGPKASGTWPAGTSLIGPASVSKSNSTLLPGVGQYLGNTNGVVTLGTLSVSNGFFAGNTWYCPWNTTIDAFSISVTVSGAGVKSRVVIYDTDPVTLRPTNLVTFSDEIDMSTTGTKIITTTPFSLIGGKSYTILLWSSGTATVRTLTGQPSMHWSTAATPNPMQTISKSGGVTYGPVPPSNFNWVDNDFYWINPPLILMRIG